MKNDTTLIKIAITDDDLLIVQLLEEYLNQIYGFKVIITAFDGKELLDKLREMDQMPDVLLLDLRMKGMDGMETLLEIQKNFKQIKTIIVSSHYQDQFIGHMLKTGANSFLPKGVSPDQLKKAINEVYHHGFYFTKEQVESMRTQFPANTPSPADKANDILSSREIDVLKLICQQKTSKDIAHQLFLSQRTVEGHKTNLLLKTEAKNTVGLVIYAIKNNIVDVDECMVLSNLDT